MKKKFNPVYTVDITKCNNIRDIIAKFAEAKVKANLPITETEYLASVYSAMDAVNRLTVVINAALAPKKKTNVFKRFWNWITRKK